MCVRVRVRVLVRVRVHVRVRVKAGIESTYKKTSTDMLAQ